MSFRISFFAWGVTLAAAGSVLAQDYNFDDDSTAMEYAGGRTYKGGPGVVQSSQAWTGFEDNGTFVNNSVSLTLSGFPELAFPAVIVNGPDPYQGTPAFILSQALPTGDATDTFALSNVPPAPAGEAYDLILYGTDFDGTGGTEFSVNIGGGFADKEISATANSPAYGQPNDAFVEGVNYVVFDNVVPEAGLIAGTVSMLPGAPKGDLNAVQLVTVPIAGVLLPGDCNEDGVVNITDLLTLLNNYGNTGMNWSDGDFNGDGAVNITDLLAMLNNYGDSVYFPSSTATLSSTLSVPEPAGISLLIGALAIVRRRGRRSACR
jgi:Dockerin type I domain